MKKQTFPGISFPVLILGILITNIVIANANAAPANIADDENRKYSIFTNCLWVTL